MKSKRHSKILDIIAKKEIETQEELVNELLAADFKVTQATVSRDIKDLRLTKIPDERGGYKYTSVDKADMGITPKKYITSKRLAMAQREISFGANQNLVTAVFVWWMNGRKLQSRKTFLRRSGSFSVRLQILPLQQRWSRRTMWLL